MFEFKTPKTFTEGGIAREANYTPQYQLTKLASDTYQLYDFTSNNAEICNAKETFKKLASIRGGHALDTEMTKHILNMQDFGSVTITASALALTKKASAEESNAEPWKVVAVNGVEYFVSSEAEVEEEETVKKEAASSVKHVYTINIKAHDFKELTKIAGIVETALAPVPGTTQLPAGNSIVFDAVSEKTPEEAQASIQKELEGGEIYLPDSNVKVYNDCCPCGCGKALHEHVHHEEPAVCEVPEQIPQGQFVLVVPGNIMQSFAESLHSLKTYAAAHNKTFKIYDAGKNVVAEYKDGVEVKPEGDDFGTILAAFLDEQINTTADAKATIISNDGRVKNPGEAVQQGDQVVDPTTNKVTTIQGGEDADLEVKAEDEPEKVVDQNEKSPEDTSAVGDDDVKRWKGMREDTTTGKYIVYITETEEHIYDDLDSAMAFMTKK